MICLVWFDFFPLILISFCPSQENTKNMLILISQKTSHCVLSPKVKWLPKIEILGLADRLRLRYNFTIDAVTLFYVLVSKWCHW